MKRVVVGIDGSPESKRALSWAAQESAVHDAALHVVYVYGAPERYNPFTSGPVSAYAPVAGTAVLERVSQQDLREELEAQQRAEHAVARVVHEVLGHGHGLRLEVDVVIDDRPARALLACVRGDDVLVVGSRGRGGFSGLLLGSVSQSCVRHAACPVVVVR